MKYRVSKVRIIGIYEILLPIMALGDLFILMSLGSSYFTLSNQPKLIFVLHHIIWLVFVADFIIRICLTENRQHFITSHLAELVAIIPMVPFALLAIGLDSVHLQPVARHILELIFVITFLAYLTRAFVTQRRFIKTNPLHYAVAVTMTALVVSAVLFSAFEGRNYSDSIWWAVVTASTTGFGDVIPVTQAGRIIGIFLMIVGLSCISMLTGVIASKLMYAHNISGNESPLIISIIKELTHFSKLTNKEVDDICAVIKTLKENQGSPNKGSPTGKNTNNVVLSYDDWHNKRFVKWARRTFLIDPKDELLIEKKVLGENEPDNMSKE